MALFPLIVGPGLNTDDTAFVVHPSASFGAPPPGYLDMDKARFWRGLPQTIGGWESFVSTAVTGVCRSIHPWDDLIGSLNVAFGTNSHLHLYLGGALYDITPTLALPSAALGANPLATTNTSTSVKLTYTGHGLAVGETFVLSGAVDTGGILAANLNGTRTVATVVDVNNFTFAAGAAATGGVAGGGSAIVIAPQRAYAAGAVDGTGGAGFGTGTYSTGGYSQPSTSAYYPATWSLGNYGQTLIANPRGGTIHQWNNVTATRASPLLNAPAQVAYALITPQRQIVALGCNQAIDNIYNPMNIRGCDLEAPTTWFPTSTNNAWEQVLEGGGRLVAGRMVSDLIFVWSDACVWQAQFIGDPGQTYRFTRLGDNCGLIGPNAVVVVGQVAYWMSPDGAFRSCALNGTLSTIPSTVQADVFANMAASQQDKIEAAYIGAFNEVWWFYPDARDGTECSRYVGLSLDTGLWIHGTFDRTAFHNGGPAGYPIGVSSGGAIYYHEKGDSADGAAFAWFWETGGQYIGNADQRVLIKGVWPDLQDQIGSVSLSLFLRDYPQGTERTKGPYMLTPGQSKRSLLADGRIARVRLEGNSIPTGCRMGKFQFDADGSGLQ